MCDVTMRVVYVCAVVVLLANQCCVGPAGVSAQLQPTASADLPTVTDSVVDTHASGTSTVLPSPSPSPSSVPKRAVHIVFVADDWNVDASGVHTVNRMLVELLAKYGEHVKITVMLPKLVRTRHNPNQVVPLTEKVDKYVKKWGMIPFHKVSFTYMTYDKALRKDFTFSDWLFKLSNKDLGEYFTKDIAQPVHIVLGHGTSTGSGASALAERWGAHYWHMLHSLPDNLPFEQGEASADALQDEKDIINGREGQAATLVLGLGPLLQRNWSRVLAGDLPILALDPWLREERIAAAGQRKAPGSLGAHLLTVGRMEQFAQKGVLYPAAAMTQIEVKRWQQAGEPTYRLSGVESTKTFSEILRAAADSKHFQSGHARLLEPRSLVDASFDVRMADGVLLPSVAEAFGIVALEAMEAGVPVLTSSNTGFAKQMVHKHATKRLRKLAEDHTVRMAQVDDAATVEKWKEKLETYIDYCRDVTLKNTPPNDVWVTRGEELRAEYMKSFPANATAKILLDKMDEALATKAPHKRHEHHHTIAQKPSNIAIVLLHANGFVNDTADFVEQFERHALVKHTGGGKAHLKVHKYPSRNSVEKCVFKREDDFMLYTKIESRKNLRVTHWQVLTVLNPFEISVLPIDDYLELDPELIIYLTPAHTGDIHGIRMVHDNQTKSEEVIDLLRDAEWKGQWKRWNKRALFTPLEKGGDWDVKKEPGTGAMDEPYNVTWNSEKMLPREWLDLMDFDEGGMGKLAALLPMLPNDPQGSLRGLFVDTLAAPLALCPLRMEEMGKVMSLRCKSDISIEDGIFIVTEMLREAEVEDVIVEDGSTILHLRNIASHQARHMLITHRAARSTGARAVYDHYPIDTVQVVDNLNLGVGGRSVGIVAANQVLRRPSAESVEPDAFLSDIRGTEVLVPPLYGTSREEWRTFVQLWSCSHSFVGMATPLSDALFPKLERNGVRYDVTWLIGENAPEKHVAIVGNSGRGKSMMLRYLVGALAERKRFGLLVRAEKLWARRDELLLANSEDPLNAWAEVILESMLLGTSVTMYQAQDMVPLLRSALASRKCVLLVDALDELPHHMPPFGIWMQALVGHSGDGVAQDGDKSRTPLFARCIFSAHSLTPPWLDDVRDQLHIMKIGKLTIDKRREMVNWLWKTQQVLREMVPEGHKKPTVMLSAMGNLNHFRGQLGLQELPGAIDNAELPMPIALQALNVTKLPTSSEILRVVERNAAQTPLHLHMQVLLALTGKEMLVDPEDTHPHTLDMKDPTDMLFLNITRVMLQKKRKQMPALFEEVGASEDEIIELAALVAYLHNRKRGNDSSVSRFDLAFLLEMSAQLWDGESGQKLWDWSDSAGATKGVTDLVSKRYSLKKTMSPLLTWLSVVMPSVFAFSSDGDYPLDDAFFFQHKSWEEFLIKVFDQRVGTGEGPLYLSRLPFRSEANRDQPEGSCEERTYLRFRTHVPMLTYCAATCIMLVLLRFISLEKDKHILVVLDKYSEEGMARLFEICSDANIREIRVLLPQMEDKPKDTIVNGRTVSFVFIAADDVHRHVLDMCKTGGLTNEVSLALHGIDMIVDIRPLTSKCGPLIANIHGIHCWYVADVGADAPRTNITREHRDAKKDVGVHDDAQKQAGQTIAAVIIVALLGHLVNVTWALFGAQVAWITTTVVWLLLRRQHDLHASTSGGGPGGDWHGGHGGGGGSGGGNTGPGGGGSNSSGDHGSQHDASRKYRRFVDGTAKGKDAVPDTAHLALPQEGCQGAKGASALLGSISAIVVACSLFSGLCVGGVVVIVTCVTAGALVGVSLLCLCSALFDGDRMPTVTWPSRADWVGLILFAVLGALVATSTGPDGVSACTGAPVGVALHELMLVYWRGRKVTAWQRFQCMTGEERDIFREHLCAFLLKKEGILDKYLSDDGLSRDEWESVVQSALSNTKTRLSPWAHPLELLIHISHGSASARVTQCDNPLCAEGNLLREKLALSSNAHGSSSDDMDIHIVFLCDDWPGPNGTFHHAMINALRAHDDRIKVTCLLPASATGVPEDHVFEFTRISVLPGERFETALLSSHVACPSSHVQLVVGNIGATSKAAARLAYLWGGTARGVRHAHFAHASPEVAPVAPLVAHEGRWDGAALVIAVGPQLYRRWRVATQGYGVPIHRLDPWMPQHLIVAGKPEDTLRESMGTMRVLVSGDMQDNALHVVQVCAQEYGTEVVPVNDIRAAQLVVPTPSREDTFGLTELDALAAGKPVVLGNDTGLVDLLWETGDVAALTELCLSQAPESDDDAPELMRWLRDFVQSEEKRKAVLSSVASLRARYAQAVSMEDQLSKLVGLFRECL